MNSSNPPSPPPPPIPLFSGAPKPKPLAGVSKPRARRKPDFSAHSKATPPCTECGKRFSSWKALFGHMRCHPEREWRGINPPPHPPRPNFTDEEYQVAATLVLLANGPPPPEKCRRNNKCLKRHFSPPSSSCCWSQDDCLLDLNKPPPLESGDGEINPVLELKLGI